MLHSVQQPFHAFRRNAWGLSHQFHQTHKNFARICAAQPILHWFECRPVKRCCRLLTRLHCFNCMIIVLFTLYSIGSRPLTSMCMWRIAIRPLTQSGWFSKHCEMDETTKTSVSDVLRHAAAARWMFCNNDKFQSTSLVNFNSCTNKQYISLLHLPMK